MFEINKQDFGLLLATLRKEKGLMQKELAQKLLISDKAVSKWETAPVCRTSRCSCLWRAFWA